MDYANTEKTQTCVREGSLNKYRTQQGFQAKRLKREVERKELRILKPQVFTLIFESYPVWLLTLTTPVITKIFLPQFDSWSTLRNSLEKSNAAGNVRLYDIQVSQIGRRFFEFGSPPKETKHLKLVSGDIPFLNQHLQEGKGLGILDYMRRGRKLPASSVKILQIRHIRCGGATNFCTLWCSNGLSSFQVHSSDLRRQLGDFIDYGTRPFPAGDVNRSNLLTENMVIPVANLHRDVIYRTDFVRTTFGCRPLIGKELANLLGLPLYQHECISSVLELPQVPVDITDAILTGWLLSLSSAPIARLGVSLFPLPRVVDDSGGIWCADVSKILPNTWQTHGLSFDKSAKDDNAAVQF